MKTYGGAEGLADPETGSPVPASESTPRTRLRPARRLHMSASAPAMPRTVSESKVLKSSVRVERNSSPARRMSGNG
jgi:hypothetical protein